MKVDYAARRVNHAAIILFTSLAYLLDNHYILLAVALVTGLGTVAPQLGPFTQVYERLLRPRGIINPDVREDDPLPHQFAQGLGSGILFLALTALTNDDAALGWPLMFAIAGLSAVNLFTGFCAGCMLYYALGRIGVISTNPPPGRR